MTAAKDKAIKNKALALIKSLGTGAFNPRVLQYASIQNLFLLITLVTYIQSTAAPSHGLIKLSSASLNSLKDSMPKDPPPLFEDSTQKTQPSTHLNYTAPYTDFPIQVYTLRKALQKDFHSTLLQLSQMGFKSVEWGGGWYGQTPEQTAQALKRANLVCVGLHVGLGELKSDIQKVAQQAKTLGAKFVVLPWIPLTERTSLGAYEKLTRLLITLADTLAKEQLQLLYHNHDFELNPTRKNTLPLEHMMLWAKGTQLKFELDIYWVLEANQDPLYFIETYGSQIYALHVKDRDAQGKMVDVGQGTVHWKTILELAYKKGVKYPIIEHDNPVDPLSSAKAGLKYLRQIW